MREKLLEIFRCPRCRGSLSLVRVVKRESDDAIEGELLCASDHAYPIRNGIPRFVPPQNYASNFGFQWKRFGKVQIDSYAGNTISRDRFLATTGWSQAFARGKLILDGGCGGGRFAEIALGLGAEVIGLDYSEAVDACKENLANHAALLHLVQADVMNPPFARRSLDAAYTMGVLQHTPDVHRSFQSLAELVKPGGGFVADVYERSKLRYLNSIYWYRPFLKRLPQHLLFQLVEHMVNVFQPIKDPLMKRLQGRPALKVLTSMLIPINAHHSQFPFLTDEQAKAWAILNTFDAYSPHHDQPQSRDTMRRWAGEAGLENIDVFVDPGKGDGTALVCRGRVPSCRNSAT